MDFRQAALFLPEVFLCSEVLKDMAFYATLH